MSIEEFLRKRISALKGLLYSMDNDKYMVKSMDNMLMCKYKAKLEAYEEIYNKFINETREENG